MKKIDRRIFLRYFNKWVARLDSMRCYNSTLVSSWKKNVSIGRSKLISIRILNLYPSFITSLSLQESKSIKRYHLDTLFSFLKVTYPQAHCCIHWSYNHKPYPNRKGAILFSLLYTSVWIPYVHMYIIDTLYINNTQWIRIIYIRVYNIDNKAHE